MPKKKGPDEFAAEFEEPIESPPEEETELKPKKGKKKAGGKGPALSIDEVSAIQVVVCRFVYGLLGREMPYQKEDFANASKGLLSLADMFPVVGIILKYFRPLQFVFDHIEKFIKAPKKEPKPKPDLRVVQNAGTGTS